MASTATIFIAIMGANVPYTATTGKLLGWIKKMVSWFNGDNYTIVADKHCNKDLVIAFCLIIDNYTSEGDKNILNIDLGRIGPQAKKFDKYWAPAE